MWNVRQWVPEYLVLLPGLRGSAPRELITKGKVSRGKVGNTPNRPSLWWSLQDTRAGWCWHMCWDLFLGLVCSAAEISFRALYAPSPKHCRTRDRGRRKGRLMVPGQGDHRSKDLSDWSIREEPFQGTLEVGLLGDFFFFFLLFWRIIESIVYHHSISVYSRWLQTASASHEECKGSWLLVAKWKVEHVFLKTWEVSENTLELHG